MNSFAKFSSTLAIACLGLVCCSAISPRHLRASDAAKLVPADKAPTAPKIEPKIADKVDVPKEEPKRVVQNKDDTLVIRARDVIVHGARVRYEKDKDTIGYWTNVADWVSWNVAIERPGKFNVVVEQGCGKDSGGSEYTIEIGDQKVSDRVQDTGSFAIFHIRNLGAITIDKPGDYRMSVKPTSKPGLAVMDLRTIWLKPIKPAASDSK